MNQEENKDIQSIKTVFIVLGVLIVCFALGFFIGRRYLVPEPQPEVIEPVEVEIDVEDASIKDLIPQLVSGGDCWNIEIYANDHKVTTKDLSNETLFNVTAFSKFYAKGIESMPLDEFDSAIQTLFDTGYKFDPEAIDYAGQGCYPYTYDAETQRFTKQETACGGVCGPNSTQYLVARAYLKEDVLRVYVKVLFGSQAESTNFFSDYNRTQFVTNDADNITAYLHQGNDYIFTFNKVEDNYVFVSSEEM